MTKNVQKYERFNNYVIYFMLYAMIGWIYEVLLELFVWHNGFVNRGTLWSLVTHIWIWCFNICILYISIN